MEGHYDVELSSLELAKIACWIDLLVPFCGDYTEAGAWSEGEKEKYARFQAKRERFAEMDRESVEALLASTEDRAEGPGPNAGRATERD